MSLSLNSGHLRRMSARMPSTRSASVTGGPVRSNRRRGGDRCAGRWPSASRTRKTMMAIA